MPDEDEIEEFKKKIEKEVFTPCIIDNYEKIRHLMRMLDSYDEEYSKASSEDEKKKIAEKEIIYSNSRISEIRKSLDYCGKIEKAKCEDSERRLSFLRKLINTETTDMYDFRFKRSTLGWSHD